MDASSPRGTGLSRSTQVSRPSPVGGGLTEEERQLRDWLTTFLTPERLQRLSEVLDRRTRRLAVVLDDIYQVHNISAVLRNCDALGIQDVHVIEIRNSLEVNTEIALGSEKWLTIQRYSGEKAAAQCLDSLRRSGYRIIVTSPHLEAETTTTIPLDTPLAIVFGNETDGVRREVCESADACLRLEMYGFVESFNLSVASGICLSRLRERLQQSNMAWQLEEDVRERILFEWIRASVPHREALERRYHTERVAANTAHDPDH